MSSPTTDDWSEGDGASRMRDFGDALYDLPAPHPAMPKATARRGTRRMPTAVRALFKRPLARERAAELIGSGELDPARCSVVWNVDERPVVQPARDLAIPSGWGLLPVRRVGTYKGARNSIAMYPVMRDGFVIMLTLESRLELAWAQQLDFDSRVTDLYAQPFAMVWSHDEGQLVHVPDLAAVVDGRLTVFDVKPSHRLADEWTATVLDFVGRSLRLAGVPFQVLGDVTPQRAHNLILLSRYRAPNPFLVDEVAAVRLARPVTAGGVMATIEALQRSCSVEEVDSRCPALASVRMGQEVLKHLLATGVCHADLDAPLSVATGLTWIVEGASPGWLS